jgi:uncharacterized protein YjbI with pentapeptide repeats
MHEKVEKLKKNLESVITKEGMSDAQLQQASKTKRHFLKLAMMQIIDDPQTQIALVKTMITHWQNNSHLDNKLPINLTALTLDKLDLCELGLTNVDCVDFTRTSMNYATGYEDMTNTIMVKTKLIETNLNNTDLGNVDMDGSILIGTKVKGTNFKGTNLPNSKITNVNMSEAANVREINCTEAVITNSSFSRTFLNDAKFTRSTMIDVNMDSCYPRNADFTGSTRTNVSMANVNKKLATGLKELDIELDTFSFEKKKVKNSFGEKSPKKAVKPKDTGELKEALPANKTPNTKHRDRLKTKPELQKKKAVNFEEMLKKPKAKTFEERLEKEEAPVNELKRKVDDYTTPLANPAPSNKKRAPLHSKGTTFCMTPEEFAPYKAKQQFPSKKFKQDDTGQGR